MVGIVDFVSDIFSIAKGYYTFTPRLTLSMMVGRERRDEGTQKKAAKEELGISEAEKAGSIKKVVNHMKNYVKDMKKEIKVEDLEIKGEEKIELFIIKKIENLIIELKGERDYERKVSSVINMFEELAKLQLKKLAYTQQGGNAWTGVPVVTTVYDIGECSNILITTSRRLRKQFGPLNNSIKKISKLARVLEEQKKAKVPKIDVIDRTKRDIDEAFKLLEGSSKEFLQTMTFQFYITLRAFSFLIGELKQDSNHIEAMREEKLSKIIANKLDKEIDKTKKDYNKMLEKEIAGVNRIIQREEREKEEAD